MGRENWLMGMHGCGGILHAENPGPSQRQSGLNHEFMSINQNGLRFSSVKKNCKEFCPLKKFLSL